MIDLKDRKKENEKERRKEKKKRRKEGERIEDWGECE